VPRRLWRLWDLRTGDKADVVPQLARELRRIGLVVYDVPHDDADLRSEFAALDRRLGTGAVAIVDHGPSGDTCPALQDWARRRGSGAVRRRGLGLAGMRCRVPALLLRPGRRLRRLSQRPTAGS
jgi:hypothetical protein